MYVISKKRNFESTSEENDYYLKSTIAYKTTLTPGSALLAKTNLR